MATLLKEGSQHRLPDWTQQKFVAAPQGRVPMLPSFIIDQIRRREAEERLRQEAEQPRLELPMDVYPEPEARDDEEMSERGVVILDLG